MKHLKLLMTILAVSLLVLPAQAADWYVCESTGSNRNEGTKASPFKNIQKAIVLSSRPARETGTADSEMFTKRIPSISRVRLRI